MACEAENIEGIIRVNCKKCIFGSNLEDFDVCFGRTIDKLVEVKKAERVILAEAVEHEYDYEQTKLLMEIAQAYDKLLNKDDILEYSRLGAEKCERCFPQRFAELKFLLTEMLRKDPIGAYVKVKRMIRQNSVVASRSQPMCKRCYNFYVNNALMLIKETLENTTLIKMVVNKLHGYKIGDRSIYRKIFHPLIRPSFMLTRYVSMQPKDAKSLAKYNLPNNASVEIFKIPGQVRNYYKINALEFGLSNEKYSILEKSRKQLAEYKPTGKEFIHPEMVRETFLNMCIDLIDKISRESGLRLSEDDLHEMANILARYTAGFGILEVLLSDSKIQDIYINSPIGILPVYIFHDDYEECETNLIPTREDAESWATRFRLFSGRPLDEANPVLDTELFVPGAKARVCAITNTLSPEGIGYSLRRHRERPWTYPLFLNTRYFDPLFAGLMSFLVDGARTILIAGGRSSGKTSLLSATIIEIMKKFRVISVEDTLEIPVVQLRNLGYNIERLKSRSVITRVEREMPADEALRTALRMGDSCMVVGEVRSLEAQALFEAMRIGALSNVVMGTIHGESPFGVFDRIVNDLKVPPASFKAADIIVICNRLRTADGLHTYRRVLEVTEVRKEWKEDPLEEGGFVNLMEYSAKEDKLNPTETLINGESLIVNEVAKRVKEWHGNWDAVWSNIELRGRIKQTIVDFANKLNKPDLMEAEWASKSNEMFHLVCDDVRRAEGFLDSKIIYDKWLEWFREGVKE